MPICGLLNNISVPLLLWKCCFQCQVCVRVCTAWPRARSLPPERPWPAATVQPRPGSGQPPAPGTRERLRLCCQCPVNAQLPSLHHTESKNRANAALFPDSSGRRSVRTGRPLPGVSMELVPAPHGKGVSRGKPRPHAFPRSHPLALGFVGDRLTLSFKSRSLK